MDNFVLTEYLYSSPKKQKLEAKASGESNSSATRPKLRKPDPYDDEYIRHYILYYYQFRKSEGTNLVFINHVSASYMWCAGVLYWITFWARDLASSSPEPKLYQANVRRCGPLCEIYIFMSKPTDEEIAAVQVEPPPPPLNDDDPAGSLIFSSFRISNLG